MLKRSQEIPQCAESEKRIVEARIWMDSHYSTKIRKEIGYQKLPYSCCFINPGITVAKTAINLHFIACFPAPEKFIFR